VWRLVGPVLTVAAVVGLALVIDWHTFLHTLQRASPGFILAAGLLMVLDRLVMSWKWQLLLGPVGARISFLENWRIYSASQAAAHLMPLDVAADGLRAAWVARQGSRLSTVAATIVVERGIGVVVSIALSALASFCLGVGLLKLAPGEILAILAAGALCLGLVLSPAVRRPVLRRVWRRRRLRRFVTTLRRLGRDRETLSAVSALTLLRQLIVVVANCLIAMGLGLPIDPLVFAGAFLVALLLARLPGSLGGLGVFDVALTSLLVVFGVAPAAAVACALTGRVLAVVALLPGLCLLPFAPRRYGTSPA
jgi:uncharacterized membrane protein YbhN (UPF0104 family)